MLRAIRMQAAALVTLTVLAIAPDGAASARAVEVLDARDTWAAPVGAVAAQGAALALRGEPGVEQAVVVWPGLSLDAAAFAYATVTHDGLAPRHELSLYFRNADGEHVIELPRTQGRATIAIDAASGWQGTVTEVGLVYGPDGNVPTLLADNTVRIRSLALEPATPAARARAVATRWSRIEPRRGSDNNLLLGGGPVAVCGALLAIALVLAAVLRGRVRRVALGLAALAFVLAELLLWRQWLVLHGDTAAIAQARRAADLPLELDWELVQLAERIRTGLGADAQRAEFQLAFEDPYVSDRLRFHLLPLRAWRDAAVVPRAGICAFDLTDREIPAPLLREETSFGPVVLARPGNATAECQWNSSPSLR